MFSIRMFTSKMTVNDVDDLDETLQTNLHYQRAYVCANWLFLVQSCVPDFRVTFRGIHTYAQNTSLHNTVQHRRKGITTKSIFSSTLKPGSRRSTGIFCEHRPICTHGKLNRMRRGRGVYTGGMDEKRSANKTIRQRRTSMKSAS